MRTLDEHRAAVEAYLGDLALTPEVGALAEPMRYALGGKRVRPVLCLATGEAAGADPDDLLPAAAAIELVHSFSLVHDDLPALDDDSVRRGRPSLHAQYDEATAVLAGDALLAEACRLALSYSTPAVARELVQATLAMIGGQYRDVSGDVDDLASVNRLKTGRLFEASVGCALWIAEVPEREQATWRAFGREIGFLFQLVDDILDGDGFAERYGVAEARRLADEATIRAHAALDELDAETAALSELVASLSTRTA